MNKRIKFNQDEAMEGMRKRIKELRHSVRYTQSKMGDLLGVSAQTVSGYESGTIIPGPEVLLCYAKIFQVDCNYLLQGIEETLESEEFSVRQDERQLLIEYRKYPDWKKQALLAILADKPQ